jgi:hypothetical protein
MSDVSQNTTTPLPASLLIMLAVIALGLVMLAVKFLFM